MSVASVTKRAAHRTVVFKSTHSLIHSANVFHLAICFSLQSIVFSVCRFTCFNCNESKAFDEMHLLRALVSAPAFVLALFFSFSFSVVRLSNCRLKNAPGQCGRQEWDVMIILHADMLLPAHLFFSRSQFFVKDSLILSVHTQLFLFFLCKFFSHSIAVLRATHCYFAYFAVKLYTQAWHESMNIGDFKQKNFYMFWCFHFFFQFISLFSTHIQYTYTQILTEFIFRVLFFSCFITLCIR